MVILKKLLWYIVFYVSSSLFMYFTFNMGFFFLNNPFDKITNDTFGRGFVLPCLFAFLLLVVIVILQTKVLSKQDDKKEGFIYGCFNLIFALLEMTLGILLLVLAGRKECNALILSGLLILILGVIELGYAIYLLAKNQNEPMEIEKK